LLNGFVRVFRRLAGFESDTNYITIAGETSPGGICIAGGTVEIGNSESYNWHDIIIRHMRFRVGSHNCEPNCDTEESFRIWKSHDIIMDHCSFSWGVDETVSVTTYRNDSAYDITFSWCIFSQGLNDPAPESNHGYGMLFNGTYNNSPKNSMSMHHNFFTSHTARSPQLSGAGLFDLRNNVIYNWYKSQGTMIWPYVGSNQINLNYVGNYTKTGPDSNSCTTNSYELHGYGDGPNYGLTGGEVVPYEMIYMQGNFGCRRITGDEGEWQVGDGFTSNFLLDTSWQRNPAFPTDDIPIITTPMTPVYASEILTNVGASKPFRDSHDALMVEQYETGTGNLIGNISYPGEYPIYPTPQPPQDSDNDGMADDWEVSIFGNLNQTATTDYDLDGYDNIEEYFHYLAD